MIAKDSCHGTASRATGSINNPGMKIYIKKPFLTAAEKRAQDWVLRAKSPKVPLPVSWQDLKRSTSR
jgi:hypothetical protein